jgi:shikimate dehydrogenase
VPVAAVLGWPLAHTLSPALHQAAYRAAGLDGWSYRARPTRPEELAAALEEVREGALAGVNLTTPHKQPAAALVDTLEGPADRLGAVNTVFVREGRLVGANTDVAGAVWALGSQLGLRDHRWPGTGPALLLGTGGVALAMAFAWSRLATARRHQGLPVPPLRVAGRDGARAAAVAGLAGTDALAVDWADTAELAAGADVLVQATTLTARGEPVPGQDRLRPGVRVLDCN